MKNTYNSEGQIAQLINRQRIWIDTAKKTYKWPISTWKKDIFSHQGNANKKYKIDTFLYSLEWLEWKRKTITNVGGKDLEELGIITAYYICHWKDGNSTTSGTVQSLNTCSLLLSVHAICYIVYAYKWNPQNSIAHRCLYVCVN